MQSLNAHAVVDQITSELALRRRATAQRRAAYLALARVILSVDAQPHWRESAGLPPTPRCDWESAAVA